jgi:GntR family transcriptional repressor for pyruvate dehydrogenase complex
VSPSRVSVPAAYTVVLEHLRREILLSRVSPGERFPPERQHAEALGVSRVTLREALRVLEGEGLVEVRRGAAGGAVVRAPVRRTTERPLLGFDELLGLHDFRAAIEPLAARRAAQRRDPARLPELEETVEGLAGVTEIGAFRALDSAFHLLVAELAELPPLLRAIEETRIAMFESLDLLDFELTLASTQRAHGRVLTAIADGDPARAERQMRAHIRDVATEMTELYGRYA